MTCIQALPEVQYPKPKQRRSTWKQWKKSFCLYQDGTPKHEKLSFFLEYLAFYSISRKDNCQTFNCHFPCAKIKHIYNIYTIPPWSEADRRERGGDGSPERSDRGSRQSSSVTAGKYANAKNQHML